MPRNATGTIQVNTDLTSYTATATAGGTHGWSPQETTVRCRNIPANVAGVGLLLTLPGQPSDGDAYEWIDADGSCGPGNVVSVQPDPAGGATIQGAGTALDPDEFAAPFSGCAYIFDEASNQWVVQLSANGLFGGSGGPFVRYVPDASALPSFPSGNMIELVQGGTPAAPITETMFAYLPQPNPNATTKALFQCALASVLNSGGTTTDAVMHLGYNPLFVTAAEPSGMWTVEQDFEYSAGKHQMEMHCQLFPAGAAFGVRPFSTSLERANSRVQTSMQVRDAAGPVLGTGTFDMLEEISGLVFLHFSTDPLGSPSWISLGGDTSAAVGSVRLAGAAGGATAISYRSLLGAHDVKLGYVDNFDEVFIGDPTRCADMFFDVQAAATFFWRMNSITQMKLDTAGLITLPTAVVQPAANVGGVAVPVTCSGFLDIVVGATTFKLPLYAV
jgi:hypothetical protein